MDACIVLEETRLTDECLVTRSLSLLTFTTTCIRVSSVNMEVGRKGAGMPPIVDLVIVGKGIC